MLCRAQKAASHTLAMSVAAPGGASSPGGAASSSAASVPSIAENRKIVPSAAVKRATQKIGIPPG